jgi:hypothetical protein
MTNDTGKRMLPATPHPDHLRKEAKARLAELKTRIPSARLADVQFTLAREYGFANWSALQAEAAHLAYTSRQMRFRRVAAIERFWRGAEPDSEYESHIAFFRVGVAAQIGFFLAAFAGVGMVFLNQHQMQTAHAIFERLASLMP